MQKVIQSFQKAVFKTLHVSADGWRSNKPCVRAVDPQSPRMK